MTVICADELGPADPPNFPARTRLVTRRAPDQSGARQPRTGEDLGLRRPAAGRRPGPHHDRVLPTASSTSSSCNRSRTPTSTGQIWIVTDNLSSHNSLSTRTWAEGHPRIHHAFIPVGACWLNLQEGWWRIFRKAALAGRSFANPNDIAYATTLATSQLNSRAKPWIWGRPAPPTRRLRRRYVYRV